MIGLTRSRALESPWLPCLITAALYVGFLAAYLDHHNPASLIQLGNVYTDTTKLPDELPVNDNAGYDGQFYYRLAVSPFATEQPAYGVTLDIPRYRQHRILYPLLARLLAFGDPSLVPYSLILVNFLCLCTLGYIGGRLAQGLGAHAVFGLLIPLYAGYLLVLARDLGEITEALFVALGLVFISEHRVWATAVTLSLAVLAKETALLIVAGTVLAMLVERQGRSWRHWLPVMLLVGAYIAWQAILFSWWGTTPLDGGHNLGLPFVGLLTTAQTATAPGWFWGTGLLLLFGLVVAWQLGGQLRPGP